MIGFNATLTADKGNDVSSLIAQILADNTMAIAQKNRLAVEKFQNIIDRALTKTGSTTMYDLKGRLKGQQAGVAPKRVYSKTGLIMADIIKAVRPDRSAKSNASRYLAALSRQPKPPGAAFVGKMRFDINETTGSNDRELDVGLRKELRSKGSWRAIFRDWQDSGDVKIPNSTPDSMRGYLAAIGMPIRRGTVLKRPARQIIDDTEKQIRPAELFEKFFLERLFK